MEKSPFGTAFVSISHSPDISIDYTEYFGNKGFIYVIKPTANIIDAEKSRIRDNSLQQECLALGGVSWSQVHGWIPQERYEAWMRKSGNQRFMDELMPQVERTPDFQADRFRTSRLSTLTEIVDFSSRREAEAFMDRVGRNSDVGWTGSFPLPSDVVYNEKLRQKAAKKNKMAPGGDEEGPDAKQPKLEGDPGPSNEHCKRGENCGSRVLNQDNPEQARHRQLRPKPAGHGWKRAGRCIPSLANDGLDERSQQDALRDRFLALVDPEKYAFKSHTTDHAVLFLSLKNNYIVRCDGGDAVGSKLDLDTCAFAPIAEAKPVSSRR
ncbi:hypothetical protein DCS_01057 [Drechmeria coniospora]|uniref:Uncharacterized protein n=1 Tax=Drechmeria coniospora TaxID=98403 RepID=A0A151GS76_DRECN|nr:hypothetical protein DCS_01057 [Drechmeria coniospora]KYK59923.1 hypothetical protein DCS_01057 [Drechmeria coniospora]